jgi:hypothetical protein
MSVVRVYRCYACVGPKGTFGKDFPSEAEPGHAVCPCGLSQQDPIGRRLIGQVTLVHYEQPHADKRFAGVIGSKTLACGAPLAGVMRSGEWAAVTCPVCLALKESGTVAAVLDPRFDVPARLNAAGEIELVGVSKTPAEVAAEWADKHKG